MVYSIRKIIWFTIPFILFGIYGLILSQYEIVTPSDSLELHNPEGYFDYAGVTHVHSQASLGSGSYEEVIAGAQESGLDFLIFTDLNHFEPPKEIEGYHGNLLAFLGNKYSYLDSRFLFFSSSYDDPPKNSGESDLFLADALSQKRPEDKRGILVLAHPLLEKFAWNRPIPESLDGIEIINLQSVWEKASQKNPISFFWSFLIFPFNPSYALIRLFVSPQEEINLWDSVGKNRKLVGFAGNDTRAKAVPLRSLQIKFPSYKTSFDFLRNHVLLDSELTGMFEEDQEKIIEALKNGSFYMSLDFLAPPKGFLVEMRKDQIHFPMGSEIKWKSGLELYVKLPKSQIGEVEIALFRDGEHLLSTQQLELKKDIDRPGVYRIVVMALPMFPIPDGRKWMPWIYSNPFFVR